MNKNLFSIALIMLAIVYSSCSKKQIQPTLMPTASTTKPTTNHKEKNVEVIVITYNGYYTHIDGQPVCLPVNNVVCYKVTVVIDHNLDDLMGLGPNGENNGNFEINTTSEEPMHLEINDPAGLIVKEVTHFKSYTTESSGSIYKTNFSYTEL